MSNAYRMRVTTITISLLLALLLAVIAAIFVVNRFTHSPLNQQDNTIKYILAPGTGANTMVYQLKKRGVFSSWQAKMFCWWMQYKGVEKSLKAGEYQFSLSITPEQLLDKLIRGDVVQYSFTLIEGNTFADMMKVVSFLPSIKKTLQGKSTEEIMTMLGAAHVAPEGLFFPDTYFFTANMTDLSVLQRAYQMMQDRLQMAWRMRSPQSVLQTPYEALILASIIEKEAVVDDERNLISGVFQRRLAKGMRLQSDPTVIYGLGNDYTNRLTREQLKQDTPFNTYLHQGLPPTPIAMPGMKSLIAALHPDEGETIYFVAKGQGRHHFSTTLQEHNQAVNKYQRSPLTFHYKIGTGVILAMRSDAK